MDGGEVLKKFEIALDIGRSISNREFSVVEGDTGNVLHILLTDDGEPVNLSGCRVLAIFSKSTGTSSQDSGAEDGGVCIGGAAGNEVTISLFSTSFAPGMVECELQIYSGAALKTLVTSAKFNFTCRRGILNDETVQSTGEYPLLVGCGRGGDGGRRCSGSICCRRSNGSGSPRGPPCGRRCGPDFPRFDRRSGGKPYARRIRRSRAHAHAFLFGRGGSSADKRTFP